MRKLYVFLMCLASGGLFLTGALAQDPSAGVIFFQHRQFKIPFKNDQKNIKVTQVRLFVSSDQGRTWQFTANAAPEEQFFRFSTPTDGYFWFAVQTVDAQGKLHPPTNDEFKSNLRVVVDTVPPTVRVQQMQPRNGEVGVSWTIRDENLDLALPDSMRVEYRLAGGANWIPLSVAPGASQVYWNPQTNAPVEVRVLARDRAGNIGEDRTNVSFAGGGGAVNPFAPFQAPVTPPDAAKDLERKFVNSKQISLGYDLKDVGPSGVSAIELWYTLYNGRAWNKLTEYPIDLKNGGEANQPKKLTFEVNDEGIYGITLVAKSGVGLGERSPQPGDRPQFWIEVDLTKPIVTILDIKVGNGIDKGKLTIQWNARDKNLGPTPIRLSYGEQKDGPWNTSADRLTNSGSHVWRMPDQLPYQFFVRVEALDLAGNIGDATTLERVKVDLSLPKAQIRDIVPGGQ